MTKIITFCTFFLAASLHGALEQGGRTHYSLRQFDTGMGRENSLWHTHTTTDIGNPMGVSVQAVPFISLAVDTKDIARQLSYKKSQAIKIMSDRFSQNGETHLPYHAIRHNTATDAAESDATVSLDPSVTVAGITLSSFHDAAKAHPGLSFNFSMPVFYIDAHISSSGASSPISDYFAGTYVQTAPAQSELKYAKLGGSSSVMMGPITGQATYNAIENERSFVGGTAGLCVSLLTRHNQEYLLSDYSSGHDNHKVFIGFDAGTTMWHTHRSKAELLLSARYSYLFAGREKRVLGALDDDGSIPAHSQYLLAAEKDVAGVQPLANILHRDVHRSGNHQLETSIMGAFTVRSWTCNLGYGLFARREENIKVIEWQDDTYAIAYPTYDTSAAFANSAATESLSGDDVLLNHRFLTSDMLNTVIAASPAQVSVSAFGNIGYNSTYKEYPFAIGFGVSYDYSLVDASPSMLTMWGKINVSF